eukprot:4198061-Karenia_brevis.AAC.1
MVTLHKMVTNSVEFAGAFRRVWSATRYVQSNGPISLVRQAADQLGWQWPDPFSFVLHDGSVVDLRKITSEHWAHLVRDAARLALWKRAAERRSDMRGLEHGVD